MTHSVTLTISPHHVGSNGSYRGGDRDFQEDSPCPSSYTTSHNGTNGYPYYPLSSNSSSSGPHSISMGPVTTSTPTVTSSPLDQDQGVSTTLFTTLIIVWYSVSVGHNLLNKRLLEGDLFPFPITLTLCQLMSITVYSYVYIKYISRNDRHTVPTIREVMSTRRNRTLILLLALGKFLTLVFSQLSLSQIPLAFTHTIKGSLPIFVVILSRVFFNTKHSGPVYLSLVPIVLGVSMASFHHPSQDPNLTWGLLFAVMSTMNLALLNVFSKKLLSTVYTPFSLLHLITKMSLVMFVPFYVSFCCFRTPEVIHVTRYVSWSLPIVLLLDGLLSFSQNILAFSLLSLCSPLTYSIANCSKRIAIISLSFLVFPMTNITPLSLMGIGLSICGIFLYNVAKHNERSTGASTTSPPSLTSSTSSMSSTKSNGYSPLDMVTIHQYPSSFSQSSHSLGSFYNV